MANITQKVSDIRTKVYGKDVRESIASGIEAINTDAENAVSTANSIVAGENTRINNENTRISQENLRVAAENVRVSEVNAIKSAYDVALGISIDEAGLAIADLDGKITVINNDIKNFVTYDVTKNSLYDANNISAAINDVVADMTEGDSMYLPRGSYTYTNTMNLTLPKGCKVVFEGTLNHNISNVATPAVIIKGDYLDISINRITTGIASDTYDTTRPAGILIKESNYCNFNFNEIQGFQYGINLAPETLNAGLCYNYIKFKYISYCYECILLQCSDSVITWVNENYFYGGRLKGKYGLVTRKGTEQIDEFNNNSFYNISLEGIEHTAIIMDFSNYNSFYSPRFESVNTTYIYENNNCKNNKYYISVPIPIAKVDVYSCFLELNAPLTNASSAIILKGLTTDSSENKTYLYHGNGFQLASNINITLNVNCKNVAYETNSSSITLTLQKESEFEGNEINIFSYWHVNTVIIKNFLNQTVVASDVITGGTYKLFFINSAWKILKISTAAPQ